MDIEKKKKLATQNEKIELIIEKVLKKEIVKSVPAGEYGGIDHPPLYMFKGETRWTHFDPYENTEQFIEVIRALSFEDRTNVSFRLHLDDSLEIPHNDDLEMLLWLIDNKDKVLDSVLEVCDG